MHAPYVLNVATTNNRIRIPSRKLLEQHAAAAAEIGAKALIVHGGHVLKDDDPEIGFDNWRKTFERFDPPLPVLIENTAGGDNAMARRLDGWPGCGRSWSRSRRLLAKSASAWTPATPTPAARSWPASSTGSRRSPGGSTWCTRTTPGTPSTPGPTGTPTSGPARSTPTLIVGGGRGRRRAGRGRDPGGAAGQGADIAFLRERLPA